MRRQAWNQEARLAATVLIQAEDDSSLSEGKGSGDGTEDRYLLYRHGITALMWGGREREELKRKPNFLACLTRGVMVPFPVTQRETRMCSSEGMLN